MEISTIIIVAAIAVISILAGVGIGFLTRKKIEEANTEAGRITAESIIAESKKASENIKKEAELQAKDLVFQGKIEFERENKERRKEIQALEKRAQLKEESLDKKFEAIERKDVEIQKREKGLTVQEKKLKDMETESESVIAAQRQRLEGLAGMSSEEAKRLLLETMENEAKLEAGKHLKRIEEETRAEAEKKAKEIISLA
ncbi:MAG: Rnase Y domain-containing protein, partial [Deltaproteobacteria bacterium]